MMGCSGNLHYLLTNPIPSKLTFLVYTPFAKMMSQEKKLKCRTIQENSVMLFKKKKMSHV